MCGAADTSEPGCWVFADRYLICVFWARCRPLSQRGGAQTGHIVDGGWLRDAGEPLCGPNPSRRDLRDVLAVACHEATLGRGILPARGGVYGAAQRRGQPPTAVHTGKG